MRWIKNTIDSVHDNSIVKRKQQQFGILILLLLLLICGVSIYKLGLVFIPKQIYTAIGAGIVLGATIFYPILFYPFLFIWLFIGNILGEISSFVILGIVYFILFTPITLILKITSKKKVITGWINKEEITNYEKLY